jgi:hypothetical protein
VATSGTYAFSVSGTDIISAAFRKMQVYGSNDAGPSTSDSTNAKLALDILIKEMAIDGLPLWCVSVLQIPLVANTQTYTIGPQGTPPTFRPLRITDAWIRDATGNDTQITVESRYDYDTLGQKSSTGVVNQIFYDPQIGDGATAPPGSGIVTVYDVPADSTYTMFLVCQRSIQDVGTASNNLDFPQEAYRMLVWGLADELASEYEVSDAMRAELNRKAVMYRKAFFDSTQEYAPVQFTPSQRME